MFVVDGLVPKMDDVTLNDDVIVEMNESSDFIASESSAQKRRRVKASEVHRRK